MTLQRSNADLPMTDDDRDLLAVCEETIAAGLNTFMEVGQALATIRNEKLYHKNRGGKYTAFEDYCREKWGMSRRHANRLVEAAELAEKVGPLGPKPESETHVRPLSALPKEQRADAWREAVETAPAGKVTASHVQEVVNRRTGKGESESTTEVIDLNTGELLDNVAITTTTSKTKRSSGDFQPRGVGLDYAVRACAELQKIPLNDGLRQEAFDQVVQWIEHNRN